MKKAFAVLATWAMAVAGLVVLITPGAKAAVFTGGNQFSGYSTGTLVHADLLQFGSLGSPVGRLVNADVGFSGAAADTTGLANPVNNEMQNAVSPAAPTKNSYGRGSGLELGLGTSLPNNPDANQLILAGLAEASAPPTSTLVTKEEGPIKGSPLIYASLLRGQAQAAFDPNACVTNPTNVSFGLGYGANVELLNTGGTNADGSMKNPVVATNIGNPTDRAVGQSQSFMHLVPNGDGTFGLESETHETVAPVTLFKGTPNEIRIELLGEWILRSTATGKPGGARVTYAPAGNPTPTTPLITITPPGSAPSIVLKTQDLFGPGKIPQHIDIPTLASISIGEDPRAIGDNSPTPAQPTVAANGTQASGAVDVVRVKLLVPDPLSHLADLRVGHMESSALVPAGGVTCPAPTTTSTSSTSSTAPPTTTPGQTTTTTTPPNNCNYNGYSTGTDIHADLLQFGSLGAPVDRLVNADVAFSGAAANTNGLSKPINNEFQNAVSPSLPAKNAYGRGSGLEVGLGTSLPNNPDANQAIIAGLAEASAPPSSALVTKEGGPIKGNPLIYASFLRGQAQAQFGPSPISTTDPDNVAFGLGYGADVQLLNTGAANPDGSMQNPVIATDIGTPTATDRAAVQSKSFLHLVPNGDGTFGLQSETHETFVPITLFKGTANEIRIELLGEWVLRATATGKPGGASVTYAPAGNPSPTTPLVRITPPGSPVANVLTTQDIFGNGGLHIPIPTLADIFVGEPARAIGDPSPNPAPPTTATNGTDAGSAVDVVRIKLLVPDPTSHLADIRVGHMESQATVPVGGVSCAAPPPPPTTTTSTSTSTSTSSTTSTTSTTAPPSSTTTTTAPPPPINCNYNGYSTGSDLHADLLQFGSLGFPVDRLVNADVAFSGAAANTAGLGKPINNEFQNAVSPSQPTKNSYGRGSGLEVGLGTSLPNNPDANQAIIAGLAEASAPPSSALVTKEGGPIKGSPLIYASFLRGQAQALFGPTPVSVTDPNRLAFGLGYGADVQLLNTGAANPDGSMVNPVIATDIGTPTDRAAVQAKSFVHLVPNGDGTFGLQSETHETFAPVTLFKGTPNELRIELLGEWVLKATATGKLGGATVSYAPAGSPSPTTPLISITPPGSPTNIILKTQDLFGPAAIPQHIDLMQLGSISIGEDPRAIGDDTAAPGPPSASGDGTLAAAAVDVVRIKLLVPDPASHLADLRIGHMESQAQVPAGGVRCAAPPPPPTTTTTTASTTTSTTSATSTTSTTSTTAPPSSTTTTEPPTTTTTVPVTPGQTTTTTEPPTTTTTVAVTPGQTTTTTTTPGAATPVTPNEVTTTTTEPPQVAAQTFTQASPAVAVSATPNFTG